MYKNAVQWGHLQPRVSKPIYRGGYLGCKSVVKSPRWFCKLNSQRWSGLSHHKIAIFRTELWCFRYAGYVDVDAIRERSLCKREHLPLVWFDHFADSWVVACLASTLSNSVQASGESSSLGGTSCQKSGKYASHSLKIVAPFSLPVFSF